MAEASSFDGRAKILLHAQGVVAKNACSAVAVTDCQDAVTEGDLVSGASNFYYVYLLAARGDNPDLSNMIFAISYQENLQANRVDGTGVDIFDWFVCASYELVGSISLPNPLGSSIVIWDDDCQTGEIAVGGYMYVGAYSADVLEIIPRPVDGAATMSTCDSEVIELETTDLGSVAFSSGAKVPGCNPCDGPCPIGVPVRSATWSDIKSYR